MFNDPLESDPRLKQIFAMADAVAEQELAGTRRSLGFCHLFWSTKKRILKEKYGVDWKTPAEMNPDVRFD